MTKIIVAVIVLLGGANIANAADATWIGTSSLSKDGAQDPTCSDFADYTIVISGNTFTATPDAQHKSYTTMRVNLAGLKADGSGTVTALGQKAKPWDFEFEPGTGARKIKYGSRYGTCRVLITPK
jgi:hypothetical protein